MLQNIPENICASSLFLNKPAGCKLYQKERHGCFSLIFVKLFRTIFYGISVNSDFFWEDQ